MSTGLSVVGLSSWPKKGRTEVLEQLGRLLRRVRDVGGGCDWCHGSSTALSRLLNLRESDTHLNYCRCNKPHTSRKKSSSPSRKSGRVPLIVSGNIQLKSSMVVIVSLTPCPEKKGCENSADVSDAEDSGDELSGVNMEMCGIVFIGISTLI